MDLNSQILEYGSSRALLDKYSLFTYFRGLKKPRNSRKYVQREIKYVYSIQFNFNFLWIKKYLWQKCDILVSHLVDGGGELADVLVAVVDVLIVLGEEIDVVKHEAAETRV